MLPAQVSPMFFFFFFDRKKDIYSKTPPYAEKHKAERKIQREKKEKKLSTQERAKEHRKRITRGESPSPKEGDNNTKFFHKMANSRKRYNHISMLEVDGVIYEDESEMANQAVQFYKKLYKETEEWRPSMEGLEFDQIEGLERD